MASPRLLAFFTLSPALLIAELALWPDVSSGERTVGRFLPEVVARSEAYTAARHAWWLFAVVSSLVLLAFMATPTLSRAFERLFDRRGLSLAARAACVAASVVCILQGLGLTFAFASRYLLDLRFGLTRQEPSAWLRDQLVARSLTVALLVAVLTGVVLLGHRFGRRWWLPACLAGTVLVLALVALEPICIDPLFNEYTPLGSRPGAAPFLALANRAGFDPERLFVADASRQTRKVNAFINGLGPTERISFWDTLLDTANADEAALVLAHELGHWKARHVRLGTLLGILGLVVAVTLLAVLFPQPTPREVPALLFAVFLMNLTSLPLQSAASRWMEAQADWMSLELTRHPDAYIRAEERLATRNLSDLTPSPFVVWVAYTHPPVGDRIEMGLRFQEATSEK
ncbi:MAG: M48 family metalloprotease [Candidatus Riflebacteria bacterium]|nr:M48 family metalloprotease [Candidatus Riflebacteria bacterium]